MKPKEKEKEKACNLILCIPFASPLLVVLVGRLRLNDLGIDELRRFGSSLSQNVGVLVFFVGPRVIHVGGARPVGSAAPGPLLAGPLGVGQDDQVLPRFRCTSHVSDRNDDIGRQVSDV